MIFHSTPSGSHCSRGEHAVERRSVMLGNSAPCQCCQRAVLPKKVAQEACKLAGLRPTARFAPAGCPTAQCQPEGV